MRALVIGDTHTYWERIVPLLEKLLQRYKFDCIIQVGDLAYLPKMWGKKMIEINNIIINFVNDNNLKFYWIDGNHEDHSVLQYVTDFNTSVHNVYGPNFFYMPRGSYLELEHHTLFFVGGAETVDKHNRIYNVEYFLEEIISLKQENFCLDEIEKIKKINKPVIVIAHTCPQAAINDDRNILDISNIEGTGQNRFLDEVVRQLNPTMFFHGHFHKDRIYTVPSLNNVTTFFSLGAWLSIDNDDRKYFVLEL